MADTPAPHVHTEEPCVALVPLFRRLSPEQQADVAGFARPVGAARGEILVHAGQAQAPLFVVHRGQVRLSRTTAEGREATTRVLGPGEVGGETWFLTGDRPESDAIAVEPAQLCVFDHAALATLIQRFPAIGLAMLRTLAERLSSTERMLAARTLADVGARLAAYLLDLPAGWREDGRAVAHLPMPKKDIATYLGTTPETLSRRLASLERAGLIEVHGADIAILDPGGLDLRSRAV